MNTLIGKILSFDVYDAMTLFRREASLKSVQLVVAAVGKGGKRRTKSTLVTRTERAPADPLKLTQCKVSARDVRGPTEELA